MPRSWLLPLALAAAGLGGAASLPADKPALDLSGRFLAFEVFAMYDVEENLKQAGAAGYRVVDLAEARRTGIAVVMEKPAGESGPYEYYLVATTEVEAMERRMKTAAADGFRLLPRSMYTKALVLEKPPGAARRYDYQLWLAEAGPDLARRLAAAAEQGFHMVGLVWFREQHIVVLERVASAP